MSSDKEWDTVSEIVEALRKMDGDPMDTARVLCTVAVFMGISDTMVEFWKSGPGADTGELEAQP